MRLHSGHITAAVVVLLAGLVLLLTVIGRPTDSDSGGEEGPLPPEGVSMNEVPVIAVETTTYDIGTIPNDQVGNGSLKVYNKGKRPLVINEVRTSCACTRGEFPKPNMTIAPGGEAVLRIQVFPKRIYGFQSAKVLTIFSNDPAAASVDITVKSHIVPEFAVDPERFEFGEVQKGVPAVAECRFRVMQDQPIQVTGVSTQLPEKTEEAVFPKIHFEIVPVAETDWKTPGRREDRIVATLDAAITPGKFDIPVFISTDTPRFPYLKVTATGEVKAPYQIEYPHAKDAVILAAADVNVQVIFRADSPLKPGAVTVKNGMVTTSIEIVSDRTFKLFLSTKEGLAPGRYDDSVFLDIEAGGKVFQEVVPVKVFAMAKDSPEKADAAAEPAAVDDGS